MEPNDYTSDLYEILIGSLARFAPFPATFSVDSLLIVAFNMDKELFDEISSNLIERNILQTAEEGRFFITEESKNLLRDELRNKGLF